MFERRTYSAVEFFHVLVACQPLAVRRIDHHQGICHLVFDFRLLAFDFRQLRIELLHTYLSELHVTLHSGGLDVLGGLSDGIERGVGTVYPVRESPLLAVVVINPVPQLRVEVMPPLEGERLPEDSGGYVPCDECRLYGQGTRAAHGVVEVALPLPARHQQHARRQDLVDGRFSRRYTVSAFVQALAAAV